MPISKESTTELEPASSLNGLSGRVSPLIVGLMAFLFVATPVMLFMRKFPGLAPFYLFAGDAYYYLDIARNFHQAGFVTFDGQYVTNGFHPLWQFLLNLLTQLHILNFQYPLQLLNRVFGFQLLLLSFAAAVLCAFGARHLNSRWLAIFVIAPGVLWFPMAIIAPGYLSTWSNLNGMESCLELFLFAIAISIFREPDQGSVLFSSFLGLAVLARLDDVFYLLVFIAIALSSVQGKRRLQVCLRYLPGLLVILADVAYSKWTAGTFLPVSGAAKAGLALVANTKAVVKLFVPIAAWDAPRMLAPLYGYSLFAENSMRVIQMVLPLLICAAELGYRWKKKRNFNTVLSCLCFGTLLKCLYNFFFVSLGNQGSWYYAVPVIIANLMMVIWLDRLLRLASVSHRFTVPRTVIFCTQACFVMLCFNIFINHKLNDPAGSMLYTRMQHTELVRNSILSCGESKFVEFADGEIGFESGLYSVAGFGLALDREAALAVKEGRFFNLLQQRGYVLFAATDDYGIFMDSYIGTKQWEAGKGLWELKPSEFSNHVVEKVLYDNSLGLYVYRLR